MSEQISDSRFYMWRTLFAVVHADGIATDEEVRFMAEVLEDISFSDDQLKILKQDIYEAQDIKAMFEGVTDTLDQAEFFKFAHELVHVDGDFGTEEQAVLLQLQQAHLQTVNVDDLIGSVDMAFETDAVSSAPVSHLKIATRKREGALSKFRKLFK